MHEGTSAEEPSDGAPSNYARVHGGSGFAVCVPMSAVLEYDIAHHGSLVAGFRFVLGAELARRVLLRPLPGG